MCLFVYAGEIRDLFTWQQGLAVGDWITHLLSIFFVIVFVPGVIVIDKHTLRQILKDVSEAGVEFDDIDWRKIAHSANELSMKHSRRRCLFLRDYICKTYFVNRILLLIEGDSECISFNWSEDFNIFFADENCKQLVENAANIYRQSLN